MHGGLVSGILGLLEVAEGMAGESGVAEDVCWVTDRDGNREWRKGGRRKRYAGKMQQGRGCR